MKQGALAESSPTPLEWPMAAAEQPAYPNANEHGGVWLRFDRAAQ